MVKQYRSATGNGESAFLRQLRSTLPSGPADEVWIGDDAAVVRPPVGVLLMAADTLVEGVHADLSLTSLADLGWKAMAVNLSDIAAMGGQPGHALVTVAVPSGVGGAGAGLDDLYAGLAEAAEAYSCPIVGGDLSGGPAWVVTVAVTGSVADGPPVLRSGARPGDLLMVTGPLGAAAADLRHLRAGATSGPSHGRPRPLLEAGQTARQAGATAMMDLSDGVATDLPRLAEASGVGVVVEDVPIAPGATLDEALGGGDDYELLATSRVPLEGWLVIGRCTSDPGERRLGAEPLPSGGWEHRW